MKNEKLTLPEHIIKSSEALVESYGCDLAILTCENYASSLREALKHIPKDDKNTQFLIGFQLDYWTQMLNATKK